MSSEDINSLRSTTNYSSDILLHDTKNTGILENSLFNNIKYFHVVHNFAVDNHA